VRFVILLLVVVQGFACSLNPPPLEVATTTSVVNSGLLDFILPHFDHAVRVHAAGSGRALAMLADQTVDLVISHAPDSEARSLAAHPGWDYQKIAFNQFVVLGPRSDPADVRSAAGAVDAFRRIAAHDATFVSRGDQSGTHEREMALWHQAQVDPAKEPVLTSGGSMAVTLRQADQQSAYTLSDEATWWQLQPSLQLEPLLTNDSALLNSYAVIHSKASSQATILAQWLTEGKGRELIASFRASGRQVFVLWPAGCPRDHPQALPCNDLAKTGGR
jgi:tungstate transport system substrate-binding protein